MKMLRGSGGTGIRFDRWISHSLYNGAEGRAYFHQERPGGEIAALLAASGAQSFRSK